MVAAIATHHLTKQFKGVRAVDDLSLEVPHGSVFGFLGPNGAGKTTTMKIVAGLVRPTGGSAEVAGIPVTPQGAHRAALGYLAQYPRFYGWMSGRETLRYVAGYYRHERGLETHVAELLELVGLGEAADRRTAEYSGGMAQRLGIAQALMGRPAAILLDEPVSGLDPIGRRDVLELMQRLKGDTTVFYSTHILDDVERVADHVAILHHGRLIRSGPTHELMESFSKDALRVVLGGATAGAADALRALPGVRSVVALATEGGVWTFRVVTEADAADRVQAAVTRFAVESGVTLIGNAPDAVDLETVFLRLVGDKEVAA